MQRIGVLLGLVLLSFLVFALHQRPAVANEPFRGKTLGEWIAELKSQEPERRLAATVALREMGNNERWSAIPALLGTLRDESPAVRCGAARALQAVLYLKAIIPAKEIASMVEPLCSCLKDPSPEVRYWAVLALGEIGPAARPALEPLIKHSLSDKGETKGLVARGTIAQNAAIAVSRIGPAKDAVPLLVEVLDQKEDSNSRVAAIRSLQAFGPRAAAAVEPLIAALLERKEADGIRYEALMALRDIGRDDPGLVMPAMIAALKHKDAFVCTLAMDSLFWYANRTKPPWSKNEAQSKAVLKAAVPAVVPLLKDPHLKEKAAHFLRAIDPEAAKKAGLVGD